MHFKRLYLKYFLHPAWYRAGYCGQGVQQNNGHMHYLALRGNPGEELRRQLRQPLRVNGRHSSSILPGGQNQLIKDNTCWLLIAQHG